MTSAGVQKHQAQNLPVLVGSLVLHASSVVCGSTFVSSCCLVVDVCFVVAVSPSPVSSFTVIGGCMKNLKELIRR